VWSWEICYTHDHAYQAHSMQQQVEEWDRDDKDTAADERETATDGTSE